MQTQQAYGLARQGVYRTIQGEGALLGLPMAFIRLAGCSVACPGCDTDYRLRDLVSVENLVSRVSACLYRADEWVWITGGEPTDYDLLPLLAGLRRAAPHARIAVATSGVRSMPEAVDFLSVSPHGLDGWKQRTGDQLNLVPGLNGLTWHDCEEIAERAERFTHRWLTPCAGDPDQLSRCVQWVHAHPGWRLGIQAHKAWRLP